MPSIRRFSWGRNVFLAYGQEPQSRGGGMHWARSRQSIAKERLPQKVRGWRVWSWYGPLGLAFILGWGWAADTLGQGRAPTEQALELEPIVVTATVAPTPLGRTTAPVTVISREEIAAQQATSVTELLYQIPGVHIDQAGARGGISSIYVRGSDPNFTVVLIDGIKVNDPTNSREGSFDFSTLSTDNIERIEIVRGPLSAVYGSDLDVHLHTIVVGAVLDASIPTGAGTLDAYARIDLAVHWTLTRHWQVCVAVDNLFDATYEEFIGFPAPGVSPRTGVRAGF